MMNNRAVYLVSNIIRSVISSAAEADILALYLNAKYGVIIRNMLKEMGRQEPETPLQTYNFTAEGIVNRNIVQRFSKAMDMCFIGYTMG